MPKNRNYPRLNDDGKDKEGHVDVRQEKASGRWDDTRYTCYRDSSDNFYVCEMNQGMVVYAEFNNKPV